MPDVAKRLFSKGELDPLGHSLPMSLPLFMSGLALARNVFVHRLGGVSNRAGTRYRAPVRYHDKPTRVIPFVYADEDTHFLELGDFYLRVTRNGSYVFDIERTITGVTKANPAVVTTSAAHGMTTGDEIEISTVVGMEEINGRRFIITSLSSTTFSIADQLTNTPVNSTAFTTYASGGAAKRVYTLAAPFAAEDLYRVKYTQDFDVMTLSCTGYASVELRRNALTSWAFQSANYQITQSPPTNIAVAVGTAGSTDHYYAITAVAREGGEESLPALDSSVSSTITGVTKANPAVVTFASAPGYETGHEVFISGIVGMTELNSRRFRVAELTSTTFQLQSVDSSDFAAYVSGGTAQPAFVTAASSSATPNNTLTWDPVAGAQSYNVYRQKNGVFAFLGSTTSDSFIDDNSVLPDVDDSAPYFRDPFFGAGNGPLAVGQFQQRAVYAGTPNAPLKVEFSRIGSRGNLSSSNPIKADDAFSVTLDSKKGSELRHVVTGRDLILFTDTSVVIAPNNTEQGFGFATFRQQQQADVGASHVTPLAIGKWVLFVENKGVRVNSMQYRFSIDGYEPEDLSVTANHFFENDSIVDTAYVPWPEPIVYAVTEKGYCLAFTYAPEDQLNIRAWTRLETDGKYRSVASVFEYPNDRRKSVAFIVERNGYQFLEVMDDRNFSRVEDCYFLDCGRTYTDTRAITSISGSTYTITAHGWANGQTILMPDGLYYEISASTTDTFQLVGSNPTKYKAGDVLYRRLRVVSGLRNLAGKQVTALMDGNVERELTVSSEGVLQLPYPAARVHVGLGYTSTIHTLPVGNANIEYGGKLKKLSSVKIDVKDSRGLYIGVVGGTLDSPWKQREFEGYGKPTRLYTGFFEKTVDSTWTREGKLSIEQRDPLPLTIRAIVPNVAV